MLLYIGRVLSLGSLLKGALAKMLKSSVDHLKRNCVEILRAGTVSKKVGK